MHLKGLYNGFFDVFKFFLYFAFGMYEKYFSPNEKETTKERNDDGFSYRLGVAISVVPAFFLVGSAWVLYYLTKYIIEVLSFLIQWMMDIGRLSEHPNKNITQKYSVDFFCTGFFLVLGSFLSLIVWIIKFEEIMAVFQANSLVITNLIAPCSLMLASLLSLFLIANIVRYFSRYALVAIHRLLFDIAWPLLQLPFRLITIIFALPISLYDAKDLTNAFSWSDYISYVGVLVQEIWFFRLFDLNRVVRNQKDQKDQQVSLMMAHHSRVLIKAMHDFGLTFQGGFQKNDPLSALGSKLQRLSGEIEQYIKKRQGVKIDALSTIYYTWKIDQLENQYRHVSDLKQQLQATLVENHYSAMLIPHNATVQSLGSTMLQNMLQNQGNTENMMPYTNKNQ